MASDSSAKAGSKELRGNEGPPLALALADSRKEERDEGRRGVVGRETLVRDVERFRSCDMVFAFLVWDPERPCHIPRGFMIELGGPGWDECGAPARL